MLIYLPRLVVTSDSQNETFRFVSFIRLYGSEILSQPFYLTTKDNKQHKSQNPKCFWYSIEFHQKYQTTQDVFSSSLYGLNRNSRGLQMIIHGHFYEWFKILWSDGKYRIIHLIPIVMLFLFLSISFFCFCFVVVDTRDTTNTYLIRWPTVIRLHKKCNWIILLFVSGTIKIP